MRGAAEMTVKVGLSLDCNALDGNLDRLAAELKWLVDQGTAWVELQIHGLDLIWRGRLVHEQLARLQEITDGLPLQYTVHAPDLLNLMAPSNERPYHIEAVRATIDVAASVNAPLVVLHPGRFLPEEAFGFGRMLSPAEETEWMAEEAVVLRDLGRYAAARGVQIGLENMRPYADGSPYCYSERLDRLAEHVKQVDHPAVGITLDLGHGHLAAHMYGFDLLQAVQKVAPLVRHIHLSDNYGVASRSNEKKQGGLVAVGRGDMHAPPGFGDVPLIEALQLLSGYDGVIILELRTRYQPYYAQAIRTIKAVREQMNHGD